MTVHLVRIVYSGNKHCFLTVGQKQAASVTKDSKDQIPVYKCEYDDGCLGYFSFSGHQPLLITQETVHLNGLFAQKLGIKDEEEVTLQQIPSVKSATQIQVEPLSTDDWEIVESNAAVIENRLLDQVRVVWVGQVLPVWVAKSLCLFIRVEKITPECECLILTSETEVIVSPKVLDSSQEKTTFSRHARSQSNPDLKSIDTLEPPENLRGHSLGSSGSYRSKSPLPRRRSSGNRTTRHKSNASDSAVNERRRQLRRQSSLVDKMIGFNWLNKWISGYMHIPPDDSFEVNESEFVIEEKHFVFRVQPLKFECDPEEINMFILEEPLPRYMIPDTKSLDLNDLMKQTTTESELPPLELFQPSIVFVNYKDISKFLGCAAVKGIPSVFYAEIKKLPSPREVKEQPKNGSVAGSPEPQVESQKKSSPKKKEIKEEGSELCPIVRVVTINKSTDLTEERWQPCAERVLSEQCILRGHALVPDFLRRLLKLDVTGRVWLQTVQKPPMVAESLQIYLLSVVPRRVNDSIIISAFKKFIQTITVDHPMVVYPGLFLRYMIFQGLHAEVQIVFTEASNSHSHRHKYILLSADTINNMTVTLERTVKDEAMGVVCPKVFFTQVADFDPVAPCIRLQNLGAVDDLAKIGIRHLETCLLHRPLAEDIFTSCLGLNHGILLISGPRGSGKTSLARALLRRMAEIPNMVFTKDIDCKPLRGKRVDNIQKILETVFDEAAWRQPSVVLLEDLHIIAGAATSPDAEVTGEALYAARVAEVITSIMKYQIKNNTRIGIIATSISQNALNPTLVTSRGIHFIQEVIDIKPPNKKQRKILLTKMLEGKDNLSKTNVKELDLDAIINRTEGFVARDLENVIDRAIHAKYLVDWSACRSGELRLTDDEFSVALDGFKPVSFRNVPLHTAEELGWRDVGGLQDTKNILVETLQWPSKYPDLFANCPLRLRSGLLLYGPPGTGKTLIAGVVAKECGLNFISIKGPEVLSKYIGASEQAVRDLFIRAESARPCILFFDEFDSMAPRRGHDNTGVTDRVVNQLLTQLDGVEGLEGVYVLAATSRPDLIDGALLRPGRIDKCLHCGLPNEIERKEILEALTYRMYFNSDVDLEVIAEKSEYFSGADLKAVLYNAQLEAIHESTGFNLKDSFNSRVVKNRSAKDKPVLSEEVKSVIKTFKEGNFEIQPVESDKDTMRRTVSMEDNVGDTKPERPMSFHGEDSLQLVSTKPKTVAVIPRLDEGFKELSNEEEENYLSLVREITRRSDVMKHKKPERRESVHAGRQSAMIQVNQGHLLKAVSGLRPSVAEDERRKYQHIYDTFTSARSGNFSPLIKTAGKKATLA